VIGKT